MTTTAITVQLDNDAAQIYTMASAEVRKKLQCLISLWLREFAVSPRPLTELMDEISEKAQARGLTPEILQSLLHED